MEDTKKSNMNETNPNFKKSNKSINNIGNQESTNDIVYMKTSPNLNDNRNNNNKENKEKIGDSIIIRETNENNDNNEYRTKTEMDDIHIRTHNTLNSLKKAKDVIINRIAN